MMVGNHELGFPRMTTIDRKGLLVDVPLRSLHSRNTNNWTWFSYSFNFFYSCASDAKFRRGRPQMLDISFSSNLIHFLHQVMWETLTPKPTFRDGFNPTHENGDVGLEQTALGPHDPRHSAALAKEARNSQTRTARPYRINGSCEANQGCPSEGFEGWKTDLSQLDLVAISHSEVQAPIESTSLAEVCVFQDP